jgi:hypothetical protein
MGGVITKATGIEKIMNAESIASTKKVAANS